eukprot:scaffold363_cov56-Cylindrotheca_fusiformis.AAC.8
MRQIVPVKVGSSASLFPVMLMATTSTTASTKDSFSNADIVSIECHLRPEGSFVPEPLFDGIFMDAASPQSMEHLTFALGKGNYLPGLHDLVATMEVGESVQNKCLDAGWGDWNPDLQTTISFKSLGEGVDASLIKEGVELVLGDGRITAVVTSVGESDFVVDANPPLAGASYLADVKLLSKEKGPSEFLYAPKACLDSKYQVATFALGCFWGTELAYMREVGVVGTKVGYTQGKTTTNPSYSEVCSGAAGHAEAAMILYDSTIVTYEHLVSLAMDRLGENKYLLNQVANDKGTQYRHGVYYHNDEQKKIAEKIVGSYGEDCVTEVLPATEFFYAEDYHQQYLLKGGQSARKGDPCYIRCYG